MADPITMGVVGAVAGAALNRDDPLKGAMLGAMLGGGGGFLGAGGAAAEGAIGAAGAGAAEGAALGGELITPAMMPEFAPVAQPVAQAFPIPEPVGARSLLYDYPPVMGVNGPNIYGFPIPDYDYSQIAAASADGASGSSLYNPPVDLSWMDTVSKSQQQAIETGALPGAWKPDMRAIGQMSNLLRQPQPARLQPPPVQPGRPQSVDYSGLLSLLQPKLTERKRVSLL